jgi:hypothetical protein
MILVVLVNGTNFAGAWMRKRSAKSAQAVLVAMLGEFYNPERSQWPFVCVDTTAKLFAYPGK